MSEALVPSPPSRQELEALPLQARVALEDVFAEAHGLIRKLNDAEIGRLAEVGLSLNQIADKAGLSKTRIVQRLERIGVRTLGQGGTPPVPPVPQNGDEPSGDAEVVDGEVVADRPEHYLPDIVSAAADTDLRVQALRWFEQGRHLKEH